MAKLNNIPYKKHALFFKVFLLLVQVTYKMQETVKSTLTLMFFFMESFKIN